MKTTDFVSPSSTFLVDTRGNMSTKQIKKAELPDKKFNPDDFITEQVFYKSKDGTKIPMFIVRKKTTLPSLA